MTQIKVAIRECWAPIEDFIGRYEVSTEGRIRNVQTGRTLRQNPDGQGYPSLTLQDLGRGIAKKTYKVHHLVAAAFIGSRGADQQVNHKDGDRLNNTLANLEYVTQSENLKHAIRLGLWYPPVGEAHHAAKLTTEAVCKMRALHAQGGVTLQQLGGRFGVCKATVGKVVKGTRWAHVREVA